MADPSLDLWAVLVPLFSCFLAWDDGIGTASRVRGCEAPQAPGTHTKDDLLISSTNVPRLRPCSDYTQSVQILDMLRAVRRQSPCISVAKQLEGHSLGLPHKGATSAAIPSQRREATTLQKDVISAASLARFRHQRLGAILGSECETMCV